MDASGDPELQERVRLLLADQTTLALAVCALLVVVGGFVAVQAHTGPDTTTEQRVAGTWTTNASFDHSAVVRPDTLAFAEGDVLQNRSLYYRGVTPILSGTYTVDHAGSPSSITSQTDLSIVLRAVTDADEQQEILWQVSRPVVSIETADASADQPHRVAFEVNTSEQIEETRRIREDLGSTVGEPQILLQASTTAEATVAGEQVRQRRTDLLRIRPQGGVYEVIPATSGAQQESVSETVTVPIEQDPLRAYGSIFAMIVGLLGGIGLWYLDRDGRLDVPPATAATIRAARERDSFDEWISRGRVPPEGDDERVIEVDSLEDLVDVAIDSERRVIEDDSGEFVVFDGTTRYRFGDGGATSMASRHSHSPDKTRERSVAEDGEESSTGDSASTTDPASGDS
jgi:hypothetical protein